jgi:hypothetical protein
VLIVQGANVHSLFTAIQISASWHKIRIARTKKLINFIECRRIQITIQILLHGVYSTKTSKIIEVCLNQQPNKLKL